MSQVGNLFIYLKLIDRPIIIWKSDLSDEIKWEFFYTVAMSVLLYGFTTWTLTKHLEKNPNGCYTRILCIVLNEFWKQHSTKLQLYNHLPPITETTKASHAGHCWRNKSGLLHIDTPVLAD